MESKPSLTLQNIASQNLSVEEISLALLDLTLQDVAPDVADAIRICAIPERFDDRTLSILAGMDKQKAAALVKRVAEFSFVTPCEDNFYTYHEATRSRLLEWWQEPENYRRYLELTNKLRQVSEGSTVLSTRQKQMLEFIQEYIQQNHQPPTIREIGDSVGISSTSVVNYNLNALEKKGFIERDKFSSRGIYLLYESSRLVKRTQITQIPQLGYITAGEPIPVPDSSADFELSVGESIEVSSSMLDDVEQLFALKVQGDSMIDALIADGDIVICRSQFQAKNGDLVVAWLRDKQETTLKRFYLEGSYVRLQPANPTMGPMYFPTETVEVRGKVVMIIRGPIK